MVERSGLIFGMHEVYQHRAEEVWQ